MAALFDVDELAIYMQVPSVADAAYELLYALAEGEISAELAERGAALATLTPAQTLRVKGIALEVVARPLRNPGGLSSETIDDYTWRRDVSPGDLGVYLTPDERRRLGRVVTMEGASVSSRVLAPSWRVG